MKAQTPTAADAALPPLRNPPRTLQHRTRAATRGPRQVPRRTVQPRPGATARLAWKAPSRTLRSGIEALPGTPGKLRRGSFADGHAASG